MSSSPAATSPAPLTGARFVLGAVAVALATFMNVLDSSIANVAIPTLSGNLGVSVDEGTWVITLFAAANAVSIPLTGWLTQRMGQVKLFVFAILAFTFSSWLCGIAPTLPVLLAARVLQGVSAGALVAGLAAEHLFQGEGRFRTVAMGDDRYRRSDRGTCPRRLDHRQLQLVVDLLHQHP